MNRIMDTLQDEPYDSVRGIADKLNTPPSTIYRYLTEHLHMKFVHTKWIPYYFKWRSKIEKGIRIDFVCRHTEKLQTLFF